MRLWHRYGPPFYPYWDNKPSTDRQDHWSLPDSFKASIPPELETLYLGRRHWGRQGRARPALTTPADPRAAAAGLPIWGVASPKL